MGKESNNLRHLVVPSSYTLPKLITMSLTGLELQLNIKPVWILKKRQQSRKFAGSVEIKPKGSLWLHGCHSALIEMMVLFKGSFEKKDLLKSSFGDSHQIRQNFHHVCLI